MPQVLNKYNSSLTMDAIWVMRPSPYGNPFVMGTEGDRDQVCDKFEKWAPKQPGYKEKLEKLRGHDLICCCHPLRCHADFWLREANKPKKRISIWKKE